MTVSNELVEFVAGWESLKLVSSEDPLVPGIFDVGYGHVIHRSEHPKRVTSDEALQMLRDDLVDIDEQVRGMVTVPLLDHEAHALVSFAYNCGVRALQRSTLLEYLNSGDYENAACQFKRWNKANGRIVRGLVKRRLAEENLFRYAAYDGRP